MSVFGKLIYNLALGLFLNKNNSSKFTTTLEPLSNYNKIKIFINLDSEIIKV
jgi:hypothetical protein